MNAVPIIHYRGKQADAAWSRYATLMQALKSCPELGDDTRFQALRRDAYGEFRRAFEVV